MADTDFSAEGRTGLGPAHDGPRARLTGAEMAAAGLSVLWLLACAALFLGSPDEGAPQSGLLGTVLTLMAVVLPVALVWVAAAAARSARLVRDEARRLQAAVEALRQTYVADRQRGGAGGTPGEVERKLAEIARATKQAEAMLATFSSTRAATDPAPRPAPRRTAGQPVARAAVQSEQPALALPSVPGDDAPPLERAELVRALNFPDSEADEAGFAALRTALKHRQARQLIQASQDVLTLLSQDGIYMDDLRPDRARPEIWRRFAKGERGRAVAALGGVRDRSSLALGAGRMREDLVFRDAVHHFLRLYDKMLVEFEADASDEELAQLAETRTARAFMLMGRVGGIFD
ncbi:hypothetical protein [Wenxinia marina]|uniref:Uncharacterized protein n=1 Tax=Wenxinia marina DSM 24838 TaxID=1123501 RepID=A0A0D0Q8Y1_9RHOB|nr:hypothetical protein [Wenxinia marina]KIQ70869.1 hypothetical protein Wenmar_00243 [Wenxinia marina DSM 24838]GGL56636.1 hypothetical protein GCM10011392_08910 [Wenxinia marina]